MTYAECPFCYKEFQSLGLASHRAACYRKYMEHKKMEHKDVEGE